MTSKPASMPSSKPSSTPSSEQGAALSARSPGKSGPAQGFLVLSTTFEVRYLDAAAESYLQYLRAADRSTSHELPWIILELARVVKRQLDEAPSSGGYMEAEIPWDLTVGQPPLILRGLGLTGPGIDTRIVILFCHTDDTATVP